MTKILQIRHGHVEGIKPERFRGRADLSLMSRGIAEAQAVAHRIVSDWGPVRVYSSPMRPCIQTGDAVAAACGVDREIIDSLNDIDYGAWSREVTMKCGASTRHYFIRGCPRRISSNFPTATGHNDTGPLQLQAM
jgi:broad specificity phosphatase PhoE